MNRVVVSAIVDLSLNNTDTSSFDTADYYQRLESQADTDYVLSQFGWWIIDGHAVYDPDNDVCRSGR